MNSEIEKNEKDFLKCIHCLQVEISTFIANIAVGKDYDDSTSEKLFKVYKFLKEG